MGTPISKEELARKQKITDERWREAVELYKKGYPDAEKECERMCEYMKRIGCKTARRIFATAMLKLHMEIATEAGEMLGPFPEDEEVDPSVN